MMAQRFLSKDSTDFSKQLLTTKPIWLLPTNTSEFPKHFLPTQFRKSGKYQCNSPFSGNCGKTLPQNFGKTLVFLGYDKGKWDMIFGIFWVGFPMESQLQQVPFVTSECLCDEYDLSAPQASGSKCSIPPCECRGKNEAIYQS